jgi:tetratricopeptide (TPR) repeat protein
MPYIGRMGTLLETGEGTGRVRVLIWRGDEHAGGAAALITANPARSVVGWGPESMFVAYNQFYPPSLATIESRGASPDRSHQALLDELVTKGLLGLVSYFFILISFVMLCWRLIRQSEDWHWQVFFIACFSVIVTTFMEGLTGIPIVSTLMMFWVTLGITVTGGALAGHYTIGKLAAQPAPAEAEEPAPAEPAPKVRTGKKGRRSASARAASTASASAPKESAGPVRYLLYAVVVMLTLVGVWWFNLSTVYADMRFSEGQSITRQEASLQGQIAAMDRFLATIRSNPREDFYYLNLGRTLMTIAEYMRVQGVPIGQEEPDAQVRDILELENTEEIITFLGRTDPLALMSYAEATLNRARDLNTLNKDHYANLGRLHNFWFDWTQDPNELLEASAWYTQANVIAPQDVTLLNEHADIQRSLAAYYTAAGDSAAAQQATEQAEELLAYSWELDPQYPDTALRLGDLSLQQGQLSEASTLFAVAIRRVPDRVEPYLEDIFAAFEDDPELLQPLHSAYLFRADLRDSADLYAQAGEIATRMGDLDRALEAYQQATELEPESPQKRLSYTLVLSDTEHYAEALQEARSGLQLAQSQGDSADTAARLEALVAFLEQKAAGGQ